MERGKIAYLALSIIVGAAVGIGGYTFLYAKGYSYLTNDAAACMNCHVMREQYDAWLKSSHRSVAGCNDCHTPHHFIGKYAVKTSNGFWHSFAFTTGRFHEPIRIKSRNRAVTEQTCRFCHQEVIHAIEPAEAAGERLDCIRCHISVGHLH